jgi:conjugal transfer mating pair stabilization protein TraN
MARQGPNQSFGRAAAAMNLLQEMGKDFAFTGTSLAIFRGEKMTCSKWVLGLKNCCKSSGLLLDVDLAECSEREKKLAEQRAARVTWHVRSYCKSKTFFGLCTVRAEDHCAFKSRLGRMLQEQARGQLGVGRDSCRGLTVAEIERVDWSRVDLSEVLGDIEARLQPVEAARMKDAMRAKIRNYYERIKPGTNPEDR